MSSEVRFGIWVDAGKCVAVEAALLRGSSADRAARSIDPDWVYCDDLDCVIDIEGCRRLTIRCQSFFPLGKLCTHTTMPPVLVAVTFDSIEVVSTGCAQWGAALVSVWMGLNPSYPGVVYGTKTVVFSIVYPVPMLTVLLDPFSRYKVVRVMLARVATVA